MSKQLLTPNEDVRTLGSEQEEKYWALAGPMDRFIALASAGAATILWFPTKDDAEMYLACSVVARWLAPYSRSMCWPAQASLSELREYAQTFVCTVGGIPFNAVGLVDSWSKSSIRYREVYPL